MNGMRHYHGSRVALAAALLAAALALAVEGCGLKGALYLPPQKKTKVPATSPTDTPSPTDTTPPAASPPDPAPNAPPA